MASDLNTSSDLRTQWNAAMQELTAVEAAYKEFCSTEWDPAYEREEAFAKANGLIIGKTADYWEKRKVLLEKHPEYAMPQEVDEEVERLGSAVDEAQRKLMNLAAPDLSALRWKLDQVIEIEEGEEPGGSTPSWAASYVRQTIADYQRLLPAAA